MNNFQRSCLAARSFNKLQRSFHIYWGSAGRDAGYQSDIINCLLSKFQLRKVENALISSNSRPLHSVNGSESISSDIRPCYSFLSARRAALGTVLVSFFLILSWLTPVDSKFLLPDILELTAEMAISFGVYKAMRATIFRGRRGVVVHGLTKGACLYIHILVENFHLYLNLFEQRDRLWLRVTLRGSLRIPQLRLAGRQAHKKDQSIYSRFFHIDV